MKRWQWIAAVVVLTGALAWAQAGTEGGAAHAGSGQPAAGHGENKGHENPGVAEYILHHVGDSEEFELETPFGGTTLHVAEWFSFLRIERVPGACGKEPPVAMKAFPGLAAFLDGCWDLRPTKAILMIYVAIALLGLLLWLGRKRDARGLPKGLVGHVVESLVLFVRDDIATPNIGKAEAPRYTPYLTSLFFFVLFTNWLGLIPGFFSGTGVITVTAALAVLSFILTQVAGIRAAGVGGYLKHLTGGTPPLLWIIIIPVEVLGLFTKPFALLVRLFANMLGGHMVIFFLLSLIFLLHVAVFPVAVSLAVGIYLLEIFVGILQAYLFTLLTALFIGQGVAMGHHAHDDAHGGAHH